ncbi:hypothetical protein ACWF1R_20650, partial [Bacillus subtilis]
GYTMYHKEFSERLHDMLEKEKKHRTMHN